MTAEVSLRTKVCLELKPPPCGLVIFGASGDLTRRKLIPAMARLFRLQRLPAHFFILGCARTPMTRAQFQDQVRAILNDTGGGPHAGDEAFLQRIYYESGDYRDAGFYEGLAGTLAGLSQQHKTGRNLCFYLALPPTLYGEVIERLGQAGLTARTTPDDQQRRVIIEKPFGRDRASAQALSRQISGVLHENQIYRIDHYLGKETVQNILMLRFANIVFEPLWNSKYIDNIQVTVAESIGVGHRAGYFDKSGLLRDMFQNHMFMLMSLIAMEPPASFAADSIRNELVKLLSAIRPFPQGRLPEWIVRGQYAAGAVNDEPVPGYREEPDVPPHSATETFVAGKFLIDNWRWRGVPFYLRSGKRLKRRISEIAIIFKKVPHSIFMPLLPEDLTPNTLVLNVQPEEGLSLTIQAKQPGPKLCMGDLTMHFNYHTLFGGDPPEAYERLLLDCMLGDQTLFVRQDTIDIAWSLLSPILNAWQARGDDAGALHPYPAGSWGPAEADRLLARDQKSWKTPGSQ